MACQFESLSQPLVIMGTVLLSAIGAVAIAVAFGVLSALGSYYGGDQLVLASSHAQEVQHLHTRGYQFERPLPARFGGDPKGPFPMPPPMNRSTLNRSD